MDAVTTAMGTLIDKWRRAMIKPFKQKGILVENKVIRDEVNGRRCYCRVPIRRRRTPICAEELEEVLWAYMDEDGVDTNAIKAKVMELDGRSEFEQAGRLLSVLDFVSLFERIAFCD